MTEVPLSKAPYPQLLPGIRINGCPLLRVCVHGVCVCSLLCVCAIGWVKCRAQIPSMGHHHTWPYVTSLSLLFWEHSETSLCQCFIEEGDLLGVTLIGGITCTALWVITFLPQIPQFNHDYLKNCPGSSKPYNGDKRVFAVYSSEDVK